MAPFIEDKSSFFKNLNIIELSSVLAGPLVGTFFAELGAKVLKIENSKTNGDVTRSWKSATTSTNYSSYYASANYGKKTVFSDLSQEDNLQYLYDSLLQTDILIVNFKPGDADKFKLDYSTLKKINPKLIYASINGFGEESERVAYDAILQAETGFMSMNGESGSPSTKMPVALIDVLASHQLKEGILVALIQRGITQVGCKVSVSLYDSAIASLVNQATNWLMDKNIPQKMGSAHPNIAPYGDVFITKDQKEILFAIGTNKHFEILCDILDLGALPKEERFEVNSTRVKHRKELITLLQSAIEKWNRDDLYFELMHKNIPVGIIKDIAEVFDDPMSKSLLLHENIDGMESIRPQTAVFKIES
jgi:crotonobetainyl-CoA:carnitine CoA-transferase CaiB-like acyl-CoA transferase